MTDSKKRKHISIKQKINGSYLLICLMVIGIGVFTISNITHLKDVFIDYRAQARTSLIVSNLVNDLSAARIAALKYRLDDQEKYAVSINKSIQKITASKDKIDEIITDPKDKKHIRRDD